MEPALARPLVGPRPRTRFSARLAWAGAAAACAAILGVARYLPPDPRGFGTHERLGLPPCSLVLTTGLPCPTCGMTTAFSLMMHARPWSAFLVQPAGAVLCLATMVLLLVSAYIAVSGRTVTIDWDRLGPVRLALSGGLVLMLGWGFKIAHGLLTGALPAH